MFVRRHAGGVGWAGRAGLCAALLGVWWLTGAPAQAGCLEEGRCLEREPVPQWPDVARDAAHFTYNCTSGVYAVGCRFWEGSQALVERHVLEDVERDMVERPRVFLCPAGSRPFGPRVQWRSDWATRDAPRLYTGQSPTVMHPVYYGGADGFLLETSRTFALVYNCTGDAQAREFGYELLKRRAAGCPWGSQGRQCERADTLPAPGKNNGACCPLHPARQAPREGESIDPGTGNVYHREVDYAGAGAFALRFERHYNSYGWGRDAGMGQRWRHSYSREVFARGLTATVYRADGSSWHFRRLGGGEWAPDADVSARLWALHDEHGAVSGWELALSDDSREGYDAQGRWQWAMQRGGLTQRAHYDGSGRLAWVSDPFGRRLEFEYAGGQLARVFDPAGHRIEYEYDEHGRLRGVEYAHDAPRATRRDYHYEDAAYRYHLSGVSDERGVRSVTWRYDAQGRAVYSARAGGVDALEVSYEADGTATVRDAGGRRTRYGFVVSSGTVRLVSTRADPCARCALRARTIDYDANGYVRERSDFNGVTTRFSYDARGLQRRRTEALGRAEQRSIDTEWHGRWRVPVRIARSGVLTQFGYDAAGRRLSRSDTDTRTGRTRRVSWGYDAQGLLVRIDGPREDVEDVTRLSWRDGALHTLSNALGQRTVVELHDAHGRARRVRDANGLILEFDYDARGRLTERRVEGRATRLEYDAAGNVVRLSGPGEGFVRYEYDAANRLTGLEDALGHRIEYTLDAQGNRTREQVFDAGGESVREHSRVHDRLRRVVSRIAGEGQTRGFEYDDMGRLLGVVDAEQQRSTRGFDALGRLSSRTDAHLGVTRFGYDARDNLSAVTDALGRVTRYTHDGLDALIEVSSPDTGVVSHEYDAAGNRTASTDARAVRVRMSHDALNRVRSIEYPDAALNVRYHYDSAANGVGRVARIDDGAGQTQFAYDRRGRVRRVTRLLAGRAYVLGYAHDERGRVVRIDYPSGAAVHYVRDVLGRVLRVERRRGGVATVLAEGIGYEPFGALNAMRLGNGVSLAREFDRAGRVVHVHSAGVLERDYGYDANDNIVRIDDGLEPASSQHFGYDALERLTGAAGVYGEHAYGYDALGQRTRASTPAGEDVYHYDALSQRLLGVSGANAQAFTYDAAGHTLTRDARSYRYDDAGRLQAVSLAGVERASYRYHASGARALKRTDEGTVRYVYGLDGELLAHTDAHGVLSAEYVYLDGALLARMLPAPPTAPVSGYQLRYEDRRRGPDGTVVVVPRVELELTLRPARLTLHEQGQLRHGEALRVRHPIADDPRLTVFTGTGAGSHTRIVVSRDPDTGAARYSARIRAPAPGGGRFKRNLRAGELIAADAVREPASGNSAVHYYHLDHLGTPQALSDDTGAVVWRADYLPFGEVLETVADTEQPIRFPGQFVDEAVGAYYNYQRWYAPQLGRYLSSDPIGLDGGVNTYGYVGGNPLARSDPYGLSPTGVVGLGVRVVGGRAAAGAVGRPIAKAIGGRLGRWVACLAIFYCDEIADEEAEESGGESCPVLGATPGRETKGKTKQYEKPGDMEDAGKDFDDLDPLDVRPLDGGGRIGTLPDGRTVVVRPGSTDGRPTVEIQDGKKKIKIRYGE